MRYQGVAYRAHDPRWAWTPLSGEGARRHGGRFNRTGVPTLYLSLDWNTAVLEASQGFPHRFVPPITIIPYEVDCNDIVDLTNAATRRRLHVTDADLNCAWQLLAAMGQPVPSWELATRLIGDGAAGVMVRSFAPGVARHSRNLVLWHWTDAVPRRVTVLDQEGRLPRNGSLSQR